MSTISPAGRMLPPIADIIARTPPATLAKIRASAEDFEATTLNELLAPMFETVDPAGEFDGGEAEKTWRPMMVQEMSKQIARAGGLGLAEPVFQQMLRLQEGRT